MRPVRAVDFVGDGKPPYLGWAVATLASVALMWLLASTWSAFDEVTKARALLTRTQSRTNEQSQSDRTQVITFSPQLEALAERMAVPWGGLLDVLERHARGRAGLVRMEQDASTGILRLTGRASDATAMMGYVLALERDASLRQVRLRSHERRLTEPGEPLQFDLTASWGEVKPTAAALNGDSAPPQSRAGPRSR